jgi:hypothetical protein
MIKGHENITTELSPEEIWLAHELIPIFKTKTKENQVKSIQIVIGINKNFKLKKRFTDVRLRRIVNYYRVNAILPVLSTSNGYYVSYAEDEVNSMIASLNQRANSILECSYGLKRILENQNRLNNL